jgi:hypothetical protein
MSSIISIKSSVFDRERQLFLNEEFIEFDDSNLVSEKPTRFDKEDIEALRYGIKWIKGYRFNIGRIYCIDVKSKGQGIIKIRLKTLYGVNKEALEQKYIKIVNTLYDFYFDDISGAYLEKFEEGNEFQLPGITYSSVGVKLNNKDLISWEDVGTRAYYSYYAIFSKSKPTIYRAFEFRNEWNAGIVYSVTEKILKSKGLSNKNG